MFPEYRDLISQLKTTDHHFTRLCDKHNTLDQKIKNLEILVSKTDSKLKALEKDRDNALKWGIMVLGTLVVSMGSYIFKLLTHTSS